MPTVIVDGQIVGGGGGVGVGELVGDGEGLGDGVLDGVGDGVGVDVADGVGVGVGFGRGAAHPGALTITAADTVTKLTTVPTTIRERIRMDLRRGRSK